MHIANLEFWDNASAHGSVSKLTFVRYTEDIVTNVFHATLRMVKQ